MIPQRRISPAGTCAAGLYLRHPPATEPVMPPINVNGQAIGGLAIRSCQAPISAPGSRAVSGQINDPEPSDAAFDSALAGDICRCGTYQPTRAAIHRAAELKGGAAA